VGTGDLEFINQPMNESMNGQSITNLLVKRLREDMNSEVDLLGPQLDLGKHLQRN